MSKLYEDRLLQLDGVHHGDDLIAYIQRNEIESASNSLDHHTYKKSLKELKSNVTRIRTDREKAAQLREKRRASSESCWRRLKKLWMGAAVEADRSVIIVRRPVLSMPSFADADDELDANLSAERASSYFDNPFGSVSREIFIMHSDHLYYSARNTAILMLCISLAFFTVNIAPESMLTLHPIAWNSLCTIFLIATTIVQYFVVESSSFINAFSKLNDEVIGKLIEQEEESRDIARKVRKKLYSKLRCSVDIEGGTLETAVVKLFAEIQRLDGENDGYISRNEFRLLLLRLNICFSARKIDGAFAQFDVNANGKIEIKEFSNFIFEKDHFAVRRTKPTSISVNSHHLFSRKQSAVSQKGSFIQEVADRMSSLIQNTGPSEDGERRRGSIVPIFEAVEEGTPTEENGDIEKTADSVDNVHEFKEQLSKKSIMSYNSESSESDSDK